MKSEVVVVKLKLSVFFLFMFLGIFSFQSKGEVIDQIIAEVNGEIITYSDLKRILDPIYAQYSKVYGGEELITRVRQARDEALRQLIENKLILQEAKTLGLEMSDKAVEERVQSIKQRFPDEDTFLEALQKEGTGYDSFEEQVRDQLLIKAFISKEVTSKVIVTPKEIREYFAAHKKDFSGEEEVKLSLIMVRKDPSKPLLAEETAKQILIKIELGDNTFEEMAQNYSEGPNAEKGGDLGFVKRGQLLPALGEAAFSLEKGKVSNIIETDTAFHILMVKDKKGASPKTLQDVESRVEDEVFRRKASKIHNKWIASLKEKAYINVFE